MFRRSSLISLVVVLLGLCFPITAYGYFDGLMAFVQTRADSEMAIVYFDENEMDEPEQPMDSREYQELVQKAETVLEDSCCANFGELMQLVCELHKEQYSITAPAASVTQLDSQPETQKQNQETTEEIESLREELRELREEVQSLHQLMKAIKADTNPATTNHNEATLELLRRLISIGQFQTGANFPTPVESIPAMAPADARPTFTTPSEIRNPRYRLVPIQHFHPSCTVEIRRPRRFFDFSGAIGSVETLTEVFTEKTATLHSVHCLVPVDENEAEVHKEPNSVYSELSELPWYSFGRVPPPPREEDQRKNQRGFIDVDGSLFEFTLSGAH
ncbi:MAG: hypothetical protein ACFCD0_07730 [Gemmataceae bacterium]